MDCGRWGYVVSLFLWLGIEIFRCCRRVCWRFFRGLDEGWDLHAVACGLPRRGKCRCSTGVVNRGVREMWSGSSCVCSCRMPAMCMVCLLLPNGFMSVETCTMSIVLTPPTMNEILTDLRDMRRFRVAPSDSASKKVLVNCHYCGYSPAGGVPLSGMCPKCRGSSWERFTICRRLLPKTMA